jgi:hypothetical protein
MTREQIQLVESTWAQVAGIKEQARRALLREALRAGLLAGAMKAAAWAKVA